MCSPLLDICNVKRLSDVIFLCAPLIDLTAYSRTHDSFFHLGSDELSSTFPADTDPPWHLQWSRFCWSKYQYIFQSERSCHSLLSLHFRKLQWFWMNAGNSTKPYNWSPSRIGFASKICCSIQECFPLIAAKYCKMSFVLSVFPAPDSPLITMHWSCLNHRSH